MSLVENIFGLDSEIAKIIPSKDTMDEYRNMISAAGLILIGALVIGLLLSQAERIKSFFAK